MPRVIRIDEEVEHALKQRAIEWDMVFSTPNEVLRHLLLNSNVDPSEGEESLITTSPLNGKKLAREWNVDVQHALYRETGDWYNRLNKFPGAYFDFYGYVLFKSQADYEASPYLQFGETVHVPNGISSIPEYIRKRVD